ncbi:MAG: TonB family protein [Alphaproteobacteria bacterium]|nr:TonB family protein [Alphaproteobacteria bacterium]
MQRIWGNNGQRTPRSTRTLAGLAGFVTAVALPLHAQQATPTASPTATGQQAIASERSCVSLMPNGLETLQGKTIPVLVVRVGLDARLHDAQLSRSSGDQDLDKALVRCANRHPFKPVIVNGKAAEVRWVMAYYVVPQIHEDGFSPASSNGQPHSCQNWPESAVRRKLNGDASFSYRIGTDGSTKDIKLTQSTGDADLDKATLDCVAAWKFFPAVQDNKPVEVDRTGGQHWRAHS